MKFSVLLPTRNRLDLLAYAIETVRKQDFDDWELIVSDNDSEEDIEGYVRSLQDARIQYFRTDKFIPVTDNWNNALEKCSGDYVIMLGDDDGLMKGYFSTLQEIIEKFDSPDLIYTSAFLYAYPGVIPGCPDGFLRTYTQGEIFKSSQEPFWLDKTQARGLADASLNFKIRFDYNMQFSLVSRKLIKEMAQHGSFYQSPYPDYYASNAMMLKASRILIAPLPLVTIGISPKSFGFFYFNDAEALGNQFLQNIPDSEMASRLQPVLLPGTDMNTSWLLSMETLAQNFGADSSTQVNYRRYRLLQIFAVYSKSILNGSLANDSLAELRRRMTVGERVVYDLPLFLVLLAVSIFPIRYRRKVSDLNFRVTGSHPVNASQTIEGEFKTILDVFEKVNPKTFSSYLKI